MRIAIENAICSEAEIKRSEGGLGQPYIGAPLIKAYFVLADNGEAPNVVPAICQQFVNLTCPLKDCSGIGQLTLPKNTSNFSEESPTFYPKESPQSFSETAHINNPVILYKNRKKAIKQNRIDLIAASGILLLSLQNNVLKDYYVTQKTPANNDGCFILTK